MKNILVALSAAALLGFASAQTAAPKTPTPAQAQAAVNKSAANMAKFTQKSTNNMSRYQRTECARQHGKIIKNAKGNLVCSLPNKK